MNKKEKEQKLKELSNKYFWEQKATEIYSFILIVLGIIAAIYISGSIMIMLFPEGICSIDSDIGLQYNCNNNIWLMGWLGLIILTFGGLIMWGMGSLFWIAIRTWIENNKEKAEQRAKKELGFKPDEWGDY